MTSVFSQHCNTSPVHTGSADEEEETEVGCVENDGALTNAASRVGSAATAVSTPLITKARAVATAANRTMNACRIFWSIAGAFMDPEVEELQNMFCGLISSINKFDGPRMFFTTLPFVLRFMMF